MRRIRYQVACSLDGFIAGENDAFDWIPPEPSFDFAAHMAQFDTLLMGRRTFEIVRAAGETFHDKRVVVASRTLRQEDSPGVEIISDHLEARVRELRAQPGLDIWLYGGGKLFAQLVEWKLVDTIEPAVLPILLGGGVPMLPRIERHLPLTLTKHSEYPGGMILLEYNINYGV